MNARHAILATALLVAGWPSLAGAAASSTEHPRACVSGNLDVLASAWLGALGSGAMAFDIANQGPRCQLGGYPTVTFLDARGRAVDRRDLHARSMEFAEPPARVVTLSHGAVATFGVSWADNPTGNQTCPLVAQARVEMESGVGTFWGEVPADPSPCGGWLAVTPVESGSWPHPPE